jgi:hypothetical protein
MDTDIRDEIERSFGDGPPTEDLERLLESGRAAVRRRRLVEGGSLLLVAAGVTVVALLSTGHGPGSTSPTPADTPRATQAAAPPTPDPTPDATPVVPDTRHPGGVVTTEDPGLRAGEPVSIRPDGTVAVRPGVHVVRTIADPFGRQDTTTSAALEYTWRGASYWYVGYVGDSGGGAATQQVMDTMGFRAWIHEQRPIQGSVTEVPPDAGAGWPGRVDLDLVAFLGDTQRLAPLDGVTILQQRAHPDLPGSFATPQDRSAVAEVRFEGRRWYVLARSAVGSDPQFIAVSAGKGGDTLDEFLVLARERYAEGGGGLL